MDDYVHLSLQAPNNHIGEGRIILNDTSPAYVETVTQSEFW